MEVEEVEVEVEPMKIECLTSPSIVVSTDSKESSSPQVQTPRALVRHNIRPLCDCKPPKFLGERFCTSFIPSEVATVNVVQARTVPIKKILARNQGPRDLL